ncbi:hypothetical protein GCM10029978_075670 [Actinoallomurus acanthiterrae]
MASGIPARADSVRESSTTTATARPTMNRDAGLMVAVLPRRAVVRALAAGGGRRAAARRSGHRVVTAGNAVRANGPIVVRREE